MTLTTGTENAARQHRHCRRKGKYGKARCASSLLRMATVRKPMPGREVSRQ
ncbi:MAG: hypothetical protein J6R18_01505 [Kiritimatiellae bacterium]|nr:hypothetical protein [Kiritimatiellia bacterium]